MKKSILYVFLITLCMLLSVVSVSAEETEESSSVDLCSIETKSKLRMEAANVSVNYQAIDVPFQNDENIPIDSQGAVEYYFDIKIFNLNSKLNVYVKNANNKNSEGVQVTYKNIGEDGAAHVRKRVGEELINLIFEIRASREVGECSREVLRTVKMTLPKYNNLAEREICNEVPEFYMCQKYITFNVKPENFSKEVTEYKEKLEKQQNESDSGDEDNNTLTDQAADVISNNKYLIVGVIVVAGIAITIFVLKKKKGAL